MNAPAQRGRPGEGIAPALLDALPHPMLLVDGAGQIVEANLAAENFFQASKTVLKRHPKEVAKWNQRWVTSKDLWLNRTAILFQNRWKADTDRELLFANIERHAAHTDFFIRKAIGWSLRELAATDPEAVRRFVRTHALAPLSVREALKHL